MPCHHELPSGRLHGSYPETAFAEMRTQATFDKPSLHTTGLWDNFGGQLSVRVAIQQPMSRTPNRKRP